MVNQPVGPPGPGTVEGQWGLVEQPGGVEQGQAGGEEQVQAGGEEQGQAGGEKQWQAGGEEQGQEVFPMVLWVDPNHQ